jgi:hypothetical protein
MTPTHRATKEHLFFEHLWESKQNQPRILSVIPHGEGGRSIVVMRRAGRRDNPHRPLPPDLPVRSRRTWKAQLDPLVVFTAIVAALHILYGVPLIVTPSAAIVLERRLAYSTPGRLRMVGVLCLALFLPLVATARDARTTYGEVTLWLEGLGWLYAAASVWTIAAPGPWQRFAVSFWDAVDDPAARRMIGVFTLVCGLFLAWIALFDL